MKINTFRLRETKQKLSARLEKYRELKKQRGMTLLEIIIVLGIIGTIAAGVVILAQRAFDSKAISDLVTNTNTMRTAIKQVYGPTGNYPALTGNNSINNVLGLNDTTISTDTNTVIGQLVGLGKLSPSEARNNISGDFYLAAAAKIGTGGTGGTGGTATAVGKGYYINVNGLNQQQCRNVLLQIGNQWDYVQVIQGEDSGKYVNAGGTDGLNLAGTVVTNTTITAGSGTAILRSLNATDGNQQIDPELALKACADNSGNGIILGSR
ncbi:pilus assembly protein [Salmonella enterica subsp. enterica serovar Newport]|nr:pilus assembly protein [Salmonella enterica subsp. enterica serovar Newport]